MKDVIIFFYFTIWQMPFNGIYIFINWFKFSFFFSFFSFDFFFLFNKTKLILKWVIGISSTLIITAFTLGQFKASFFNRMDDFEKTLNNNTVAINNNTTAIEELKTDVGNGFDNVDMKIDKVYDDAIIISDDYREYNRKQLELVVDYGQENKDMLKRMLEINAIENKQAIASQVERAKKEYPEFSIGIQKIVDDIPVNSDEYHNMVYFINTESNDTVFQVRGATQKFINNINREKYQIGSVTENQDHPKRYDFSYSNK